MDLRTTHLKIKIKYLSAESKIIRHEEKKILTTNSATKNGYRPDYESLYRHRKDVVGYEARHCLLAYTFLRNKPYALAEEKTKPGNEPKWKKVRELAKRFSTDKTNFSKNWEIWLTNAKEHLNN